MDASRPADEPDPEDATDAEMIAEARWPMAGAVLTAMILTLLLPEGLRHLPRWLLPCVEGVLLVALIVGDPGAIDRRSNALRSLSITLVAVLVAGSLWSTGLLIDALIEGSKDTDSAGDLLATGAIVWIANNIAFSLLYWELDGGGAAARAHLLPKFPDFAFPQQLNPDLAPASWRPRFFDYLYLGFTNATAFSPTDAMPLAPLGQARNGRPSHGVALPARARRGPGGERLHVSGATPHASLRRGSSRRDDAVTRILSHPDCG